MSTQLIMSELLEIRRGSDLSPGEKNTIISAMLDAGESKDMVRAQLASEYNITEGSISSLLAHATMRRQRELGGKNNGTIDLVRNSETIQGSTQDKVYSITSMSGLSEEIRHTLFTEFRDIANEHVGEMGYDYYEDIGAISEYYDIDPTVLEEYLRNRFKWFGTILDSLKKDENTDNLTYEDKTTIRDYVESGIDKEDKKKRRKEMSLKYNVSIYTIGAITAWKKGEDGSIRLGEKTTGVSEWEIQLPRESTLVVENIDNGDITDSSLLEEDLLDAEFILELAKGFDLDNDAERQEFLDDVFDCFPDGTLEDIKRIIPDFPDNKTHTNEKRSGEGMGALVEYDNEIKNKWRQKLKEFIDENTDITKRKDMKVLCLPGLKCLEIPLYLELGFRPENIVGVEAGIVKGKKDPELIRQFEENAGKYGIQTRIGKLEKILETEKIVFDVISLDFLGPISPVTFDILQGIKVANRCLLLTNFLGKRESVSTLKYYTAVLGHQNKHNQQHALHGNENGVFKLARQSEWLGVSLARQLNLQTHHNGLAKNIMKAIDTKCEIYQQHKGFASKRFTDLKRCTSILLIEQIIFTLDGYFRSKLERNNILKPQYIGNMYVTYYSIIIDSLGLIHEYLLILFGYSPTVINSKRYLYNAKSPMFSDFTVLKSTGGNKLNDLNELNRFLLILINIQNIEMKDDNESIDSSKKTTLFMSMRNSKSQPVRINDPVSQFDELVLGTNNNIFGSVNSAKFIKDIARLPDFLNQFPNKLSVERKKI